MKKSTKHLPRESLGDSYNSVGMKHFLKKFLFKMVASKKLKILKPPILKKKLQKFQGLIDGKGIDVAQPIWLRDCPT